MYINSINHYSVNAKQNTFGSKKVVSKVVSKAKLSPVEQKEKMKILLASASDIFSLRPKCRVPKTAEEKEIMLEILKHRLKLDILIKLSNDRYNTNKMIDKFNDLVDKEPKSEECFELEKEIRKKGNLKNYYKMNHRLIEDEKKRQKLSMDYFKEIFGGVKPKDVSVKDAIKLFEQGKNFEEIYVQEKGLEEKFIEEGKITDEEIGRFEQNVNKNNINKDEKFSIKDLINIIEGSEIVSEVVKAPKFQKAQNANNVKPSNSEIVEQAEKIYENYLKEVVDIYSYEEDHWKKAIEGKKVVERTFANHLKYDNSKILSKKLEKMYKEVEKRFTKNAYKLENVRYNDVGAFWNMLKEIEESMQECLKEMDSIKSVLQKNKNDKELKEALEAKKERFEELKENWIMYMEQSVSLENENYKIMEEAGVAKEYNYLVERHKDLNKYTSLFKVYKQNNDSIPENIWLEMLN